MFVEGPYCRFPVSLAECKLGFGAKSWMSLNIMVPIPYTRSIRIYVGSYRISIISCSSCNAGVCALLGPRALVKSTVATVEVLWALHELALPAACHSQGLVPSTYLPIFLAIYPCSTYVCICMHMHNCMLMYVCTYAYTYMYMSLSMFTYMYMYTHIYI